jgi:hypothetical protein
MTEKKWSARNDIFLRHCGLDPQSMPFYIIASSSPSLRGVKRRSNPEELQIMVSFVFSKIEPCDLN